MASSTENEYKFQLLSDIHLEMPMVIKRIDELLVLGTFDALPFPASRRFSCLAQDIVLLGDVVTVPRIERLGELAEYLYVAGFQRIIYIPGNHEYYTKLYTSPAGVDAFLREQCPLISAEVSARHPERAPLQMIFLNCDTLDLPGGYRMLGCALWSHVPEEVAARVQSCISSYALIYTALSPSPQQATVAAVNGWHQEHVAWLRSEIQRAKEENKKVLVFTHFKPTLQWPAKHSMSASLRERSSEKKNKDVSWAYQADCDALMDPEVVKAWFYGHDHASIVHYDQESGKPRFVVNGVPLFSNQLGYITKTEAKQLVPGGLNEGFDGQFVWKYNY